MVVNMPLSEGRKVVHLKLLLVAQFGGLTYFVNCTTMNLTCSRKHINDDGILEYKVVKQQINRLNSFCLLEKAMVKAYVFETQKMTCF